MYVTHTASLSLLFFFFNDTATTEIYTLSLHDALPIFSSAADLAFQQEQLRAAWIIAGFALALAAAVALVLAHTFLQPLKNLDRKSTRLNSSHSQISYAVFCLKKKKNNTSMFLDAVVST